MYFPLNVVNLFKRFKIEAEFYFIEYETFQINLKRRTDILQAFSYSVHVCICRKTALLLSYMKKYSKN